MPRRRPSWLPALLLLLFAPALFSALVELYTDWLWFREVGYERVFARTLGAKLAAGAAAFALALGFLGLNLRVALRTLRRRQFAIMTDAGPTVIDVDPMRLRPLLLAGAALASLFVGFFVASRWETVLLYLHAQPFGRTDPILGHDVGFYVFELPFLRLVRGVLLVLVLVAAAGAAAIHATAGNLAFDARRGVFVSGAALRQLAALAAAFLLLLAFGARLAIPELLLEDSGIIHGASYVDVHARMPALRLLAVVCVVGAGLALYQARVRGFWPILSAGALYLLVSAGGAVWAAVLHRFVVAPDEQVRETPYIVHHVAATRAAFALDAVEERQLSGEAGLRRADLARNAATLENVPLWNEAPLLDTFSQIQEIRTYYDFTSVDNDRYVIDGEYRQIMLSARELDSASLPSRTWINERLTFTHGYGLTLGPVNEVTPEGLPVLFIKDLPPTSSVDLEVTQPAIYYGELSNDHVFVNTGTPEFDYPKGEDNVFASYQGRGGIPLHGFGRRLLFALRFRSTDTLFSPSLTPESRVMLHRRVADRVRRIAPFLAYDPDPYVSLSGGRMVWIQDAYTTSERYPYAASAGARISYIRNAVKVTVDAYHGTTTFHLLDPDDPIAATLDRAFPGLFTPLGEMPEDLRSRLRYPKSIFGLQAAMFATFHMGNPAVFYNKEDQWEIPSVEMGGEPRLMQPYYTIMKLPGESEPEYIQMLPFTPRQKDNLSAWMVARSDGENYGRLVAFQFPKQTLVFGPRQVAARINQDQAIAPQITLWNQQGSEVIHGSLLVIPIEESLVYIRPLYLRAQGGRIPELKRVVVAYQNQIVMEETLDGALARLFPGDGPLAREMLAAADPGAAPDPPPAARASAAASGGADAVELAEQARAHYQRALEAQRAGDWARYGDEIGRLGEVLERLPAAPPP
jgi:hypothetical protein